MGLSSLLHGLSTKDPRVCAPAAKGPLNREQLLRNRYQTGPNFGALFVQEKWIDNSLFNPNNDKGGSELAALESWEGASVDELRQKWEAHWQGFITQDDWALLEKYGVTCIRLPIGFYSVGDAELLKHTPFEKFAGVYENSWQHIERVVLEAHKRNISVLLDVHALPGGANGDEHSGTNSGKAELWHSARNRDGAIDTYLSIISKLEAASPEVQQTVVALQLVNEAPYGESKRDGFYLDAASKIRESGTKVGEQIVLVISDSWDCNELVNNIKEWNEKAGGDTGFVVDTHVYRTFSDEDKQKSAEQHIAEAKDAVKQQSDVDVFVGEWSCCLDEETWKKSKGDRNQLEGEFGKAQIAAFKNLAGNFFWTFKFGQGSGGSWDWREMVKRGVYIPKLEPGKGDFNASLEQSFSGHKRYWTEQDSSRNWEFERFELGFKQGWQDAEEFAKFNGSRLGRLAALKQARTQEHIESHGASDNVFQFEHGYEQAVRARNSVN